MEKQPFAPTPEPEMPQYVQSISDRRPRNQDGTFISAEAVENADNAYAEDKANYDAAEAERLRVYGNAAELPEDVDASRLSTSELQEKLDISYKEAYELNGAGAEDLVSKARNWKAEQATTQDGTDESVKKNRFANLTTSELGRRLELDVAKFQNLKDIEVADGEWLESRINSAFDEFAKKKGWSADEIAEKRIKLHNEMARQVEPSSQPEMSEEYEPEQEEQKVPSGGERIELGADVLGGIAQNLAKEYNSNKTFMTPEQVKEAHNKIFTAFEQQKAAAGWDPKETLRRQGQLFDLMGDRAAEDAQSVYDNIDEQAAAGEVEDVALPGESKAETMDRIVEEMTKEPEEVAPEDEITQELDVAELFAAEDKEMWEEADKAKKFYRLRKFGRGVLVNLGLRPDPNQGESIVAPNRRNVAPELVETPVVEELSRPVVQQEAGKPLSRVATINPELAQKAEEDEDKAA